MKTILEEIRDIEGAMQQPNLTIEEGRELQKDLDRLYAELAEEPEDE